MRPRLIATVAAAWVLVGLFGAWTYGHDYWVTRGFPPPVDPSGVSPGRLVKVGFYSPALRQRRLYDI